MNHSWKQRIFISFANGFECYDIAVYAAISSYAAINFFPESAFGGYGAILVWFPFILRFISRPFGGLFLGHYADKYGRKSSLILSSTITGIATLIMACLPTYADIGLLAPCLFFLMQLLQAFSFGGELPTTSVFLLENSQHNERARIGAFMVSFNILAVTLSLLITLTAEIFLNYEQMLSFGWRIPVFIGVVNLIIGYYFRVRLVESAKFESTEKMKVEPVKVFKIFLRFVPNTILFYANTLCTKTMIKNLTDDAALQSYLPIAFNVLCAMLCVLFGFIIDKRIHYSVILKRSYGIMVVLAVPIYALQTIDSLFALLLSQLCIALFVAISMSATIPDLFDQTSGSNKIATLGLGINLGVVLVGAFVPMLVTILSGFGQAYVGLMISFGGLCFFAALALDKYTQNQPQRVQPT